MPTASILVLRIALATATPEIPPPPGQPRLEWTAPPECPNADRGAEHLARFLGGRALPAPARVVLAPAATGHVATVTVDGASRTLQASDCDTLARAAALVVAVSLEPVAAAEVLREPEPEPEPPTPAATREGPAGGLDGAPTPVVPTFASSGSPTPAPSRAPGTGRASVRGVSTASGAERRAAVPRAHWLAVSAGPALALVPTLTGAVRLGYAFERKALRVQANATYAVPRVVTYPDSTVGGRFQSVAVGAHACLASTAGRVTVPLCAGLEGGAIFGRGQGVNNPRNPVGGWLGAVAGGSVVFRARPRLALSLGADLIGGLWRHAFHVGALGTLFRVPLVGLRAMVGLELRLR